ncbi:10602_t:CDS:2 [Paraglomus occultum]|uniref:10602_t:CDS:1 n=1 Tax=Paraglomus occultum TaxID=144539 RepID=A0A9N9A9M0_9GLOM|nr:10602_t:CDS:2 [Paraglomus occultum]
MPDWYKDEWLKIVVAMGPLATQDFKVMTGVEIDKWLKKWAREKWYELRSLNAPRYNNEFSYGENDWPKITRWAERVTGQFLDAFEFVHNPLVRHNCNEREWTGNYIAPLIQGVLMLYGSLCVPW